MTGRADYETRREARIDRMRARAEKLQTEGERRIEGAQKIARIIPLGQPILVGHHSEKRHRKDIARIDQGYSKGLAALKEAETLERRADSAESNRAISSDDPQAIEKLRAKLDRLEKNQASMIAANRIIRKNPAEQRHERLVAAGFTPEVATAVLTPDCFGGIGFASYKTSNNRAEITRVKKRLAALEREAARPEESSRQIGEVEIRERDNRVQLIFPGKPSDAVRKELKSYGFRWAPSEGAWQRLSSNAARYHAERIAEKFG